MVSEKDGMVLVYVPEGEFTMGSNSSSDDEKPEQQVTLDAFWIDQTEITNAMYAKCVAANQCDPLRPTESYTHPDYYGNSEFDDYPVIYVSWNDALAYCTWTGRRLTTEAEWEKAARSTDGRVYPWGDSIDCSFANYWGKDGGCVGDTTAVKSYESGKSIYGAFDMAGNVWEWVSSLYMSYPYDVSDGREDTSSSDARVLRGGSWYAGVSGLRSADRLYYYPTNSGSYIGFRCARSP